MQGVSDAEIGVGPARRRSAIKYLVIVSAVAMLAVVISSGLLTGDESEGPDLDLDVPEADRITACSSCGSFATPSRWLCRLCGLSDPSWEALSHNENDLDAIASGGRPIPDDHSIPGYSDALCRCDAARAALADSNEPLHALGRGANHARLGSMRRWRYWSRCI